MKGYKLLVSSSIAPFREKAERTWNIERYVWPRDIFKPTVFFGMYHIGDYSHYLRHLGPKSILWAGSDITNLLEVKLPWYKLFRSADNYCENGLERKELDMYCIRAKIVPSFLEEIPGVSYKWKEKPNVYISVRRNRKNEYGLSMVIWLAKKIPDVTYHVYGNYEFFPCPKNVVLHGTVPNEQFNREIKDYQCGLRTNSHDGFSEITAKSILMGQYPITRIQYPGIPYYKTEEELINLINSLKEMKEPNLEIRQYYLDKINLYPWTSK